MNFSSGMQLLDWSVCAGLLVGLVALLIFCQRYSKSVSGFLSASRCAGRYLLCVAGGASSWDAIGAVATFEMFYEAGFTSQWWTFLTGPMGMILALFGWVTYRLRETRCFTVAQFFEVRYSRKFRVCAGIISWLSGIVNFGIFPAISIRFVMFFCQFPEKYLLWGINWDVYAVLLTSYVSLAVCFAIFGGQIAIMLTDFAQATLCNLSFIVFILFIFKLGEWDLTGGYVSWAQIAEALRKAPDGMSQTNPFDCSKLPDFNMWYFMIGLFSTVYSRGTWQGSMGYSAAALTPHEGKMAGLLGTWRGLAQTLLLMLFPLAVIVFMRCPEFAALKTEIETKLALVDSPLLRSQGLVPTAMSIILPTGLLGLFLAVMFAGMLSTDDTYMHSWGSIFIQDVIMPFRKKPFTAKQHLWALRLSIIGVGIFSIIFSYYFRQTDHIFMFFSITGAIISGAGAVMIGGLYWKYGTTLAAWVSYLIGALLAVGVIILQQVWHYADGSGVARFLNDNFHWQWVADNMGKFPINGRVMSFYIMVLCLSAYIIISLSQYYLGKTGKFNLDKMLHRGKYDTHEEHKKQSNTKRWEQFLGITTEFSLLDRIIYFTSIVWTMSWFALFVIYTSIYFGRASMGNNQILYGIGTDGWINLWHVYIYIMLFIGVICTIWLATGGLIDVFRLFYRLNLMKQNDADDGTVRNGDNVE